MEKFIFSLNLSKFVGKLRGRVSVSAHVDTLGNTLSSVNPTVGVTSPKPSGGVLSQPVKKTMTSLRVGDFSFS